MSPEKTPNPEFRSFENVKNMIAEINSLFGDIKNPSQVRVSGKWNFPLIGLELEYNNKDCNGACSTNCSGCSACSGCKGCSSTSTSTSKFDPSIFEMPGFKELLDQVRT